MDQARSGRFKPGQSGNPKGRPRRDAARPPAAAPSTERRDGWINSASGHGTSRDRRTLTQYGVDIVTDIEALQLWRSEFLAASIIEKRTKEALRRGWSLKIADQTTTKQLAEQVCAQAEALGLARKFVQAWQYERAYGGAAIFPVLSGALGELSQPLDEGAIASVDAFHVFEPQELQPASYYQDIRRPEFGQPETYRLMPLSGRAGYIGTQIIHATRLVVFPGIRVSRQTQPGQRDGWGDSCLSRPNAVLKDFGIAWGSAATLLHEHGKGTLAMDGFADMMAQADGLEVFDRHIAAMQLGWNTLKMAVVDGKSKFERSTGALGGVAEMLREFKTLMAAAADEPVSVLFGEGASGLRTGDDDTRKWYATVEGDRADHHPLFEQLVRFLLLATSGPTSGVEPEVWSVEFPPLYTPSEKEVAETRKTDMERAKIAIEAGIASADDVAESFYGGDTYSPDIVIDWDRRKAQAVADAEPAEDLDEDDLEALGAEADPDEGDEGEPDDEADDEPRADSLARRGEKWLVLSKAGKELGAYDTEAEARERLRQIEAAKAAREG